MDALGILQIARLITEDPDVFREDISQHPQFYNWIESLRQAPESLETMIYNFRSQLNHRDIIDFLNAAYDLAEQGDPSLSSISNKLLYYLKQIRNENWRSARKRQETAKFNRARSDRVRRQETQRRTTARLAAIKSQL